MRVIDASVVVSLFVGGEPHAAFATRLMTSGEDLWAPHLLDAEVGHALRRTVLAGLATPEVAPAAIEDLRDLPLERVPHGDLLERAWELRENVTFYDAIYVALAERLDAPLVTFDDRLAHAATGLVDVVGLD